MGLLVLAAACTPRTPPERDGGDGHDVATTASGGGSTATDPTDPADRPIAELRPFEEATRAAFDFEGPPSAETGLGADPWTIRRVPSGWVGILRGRSAIVLLDDELHELARLPTPRSPTGLAVAPSGELLVAGELSPSVARYAVRGRTLESRGEVRVPGVLGLRDVAVSPAGAVWVLDERGGRLLGLDPKTGDVIASFAVGHGAVQVLATAKHVVVDAVTDHALLVFDADASGAHEGQTPRRITHDGPMWGFDARETEGGLLLAAGGVEDHPLDRRQGFFGYIDSFVYVYRMQGTSFEKLAELNVSEQGVVTPKAVAIETTATGSGGDAGTDTGRVELFVTGFGSASGLRIDVRADRPAVMTRVPLVPGLRALEHTARTGKAAAMADPLLDAWVLTDARGVHVVPVPEPAAAPARTSRSRLGEALFFTSLMAPRNKSEGSLSRFTCETCHFEGYVDGRTHHTGRDDIHATTKPLVGLVGNRPYFSRALDPDLATVSHAEFRVAGAGSGTDPLFAVEPHDPENAWLEHLGVRERVGPLELRRSLLRFLVDFSHRPNSAVVARNSTPSRSFDVGEREGAQLFRERCESCHSARLSADDPSTHVAFEKWEAMVLSDGAPIVWGSAGYHKTGVTPYVAPEGARTPSLRRLYKKHPYFTNGTASSLDEVLGSVRFTATETFHAAAPPGATPLDDTSKRALHAFLELL